MRFQILLNQLLFKEEMEESIISSFFKSSLSHYSWNRKFFVQLLLFNSIWECDDRMNDELDLSKLQTTTLESWALDGNEDTMESNSFIMKSKSEYDMIE